MCGTTFESSLMLGNEWLMREPWMPAYDCRPENLKADVDTTYDPKKQLIVFF